MSTKPEVKVAAPQAVERVATRFIIAHGDKGGVGKSMLAQALADFLSSQGQKVAIIDADTQNPDVYRMFSKTLQCAQANIREENGWMDVMEFVVRHPGHTIIMNTPAGIGEYMKNELVSLAEFLRGQETPVEMELWWTMNANHDSVNLFAQSWEKYGQVFAKVRVVCNLHFTDGNQGSYVLWNESPLKTRIEKNGGMTIYLPGLNIRVVTKVFVPGVMMPFSSAVDAAAGEEVGLGQAEQWKLKFWLAEVAQLFAPAFGMAPVAGK